MRSTVVVKLQIANRLQIGLTGRKNGAQRIPPVTTSVRPDPQSMNVDLQNQTHRSEFASAALADNRLRQAALRLQFLKVQEKE